MKQSTMVSAFATVALVVASWLPSAFGQQKTPQAQTGSGAFTSQVSGTVTAVDHQSGKLTVRGPEGAINVRLPPPALHGLNVGDTVTVVVGLMERAPAASPSTSPRPGTPGRTSRGAPSSGSSAAGTPR